MMKVEVSGISGLIANVRAVDALAQVEIRRAVKQNGERQRALTEAVCPKDTGFMASRTKVKYSDGGLTFTVGYYAEDFPATFYPPFVVLGTSKMEANDFLFRVHEMLAAENTRNVGDGLRRSFARFR